MIESAVFGLLSTMILVPAVLAVSLKNIFHGALWLVVSLTGVGGMFALLGSDFLFVSQILVYAGGITVLLLFVVLLSGSPKDWVVKQVNAQGGWGLVAAGIFVGFLTVLFRRIPPPPPPEPSTPVTANLGLLLIRDWVFPFEAVSLVLLAALIGAVHFSKRDKTSC